MAGSPKARRKKTNVMKKKTLIIIYSLLGVVLLASLVLIFASLKPNEKQVLREEVPDVMARASSEDDVFKINSDTELSNRLVVSSSEFSDDGDLAVAQALALHNEDTASVPMIMLDNVDGKLNYPDLRSRVAAAKLRNEDTVGWFRVNNSNMNFAVVQNLETNNYYTEKGYDKEYSYHSYGSAKRYSDYGVVWASRQNVFTSREDLSTNTVLFGHNWENIFASPRVSNENDIMFEQLAAYCYADYAQSHPLINFSIESEDLQWVVVSAFYTEEEWTFRNNHLDFNYINADLTNEQTQLFIDEITARGEYTSDVEMDTDDKFLTLSTCTRARGNTETQRFVVVAKLLERGEELPAPVYTVNPSPKAPLL